MLSVVSASSLQAGNSACSASKDHSNVRAAAAAPAASLFGAKIDSIGFVVIRSKVNVNVVAGKNWDSFQGDSPEASSKGEQETFLN